MSIEAMKQALEALESGCKMQAGGLGWIEYDSSLVKQAVKSLRQAIATEESSVTQEPVAWDANDPKFDAWWNGEYDDSTNPYRKDSPAYWAWAGWKAAQPKAIINNYPEKDNLKENT